MMNLPFFLQENISTADNLIIFDEETSKHIVQVLRMKPGEPLRVTDGKGQLLTAEILKDQKKRCEVKIIDSVFIQCTPRKISIAISLVKNVNRFEWFLEKATELGVREIIPMICERTEKQNFRFDRLRNICVSAMLQSQQTWLPKLSPAVAFSVLIKKSDYEQKFIAHCTEMEKINLSGLVKRELSQIILIGPEGGFTKEEIDLANRNHYVTVSLGETRLRTETAGVASAAILALQ